MQEEVVIREYRAEDRERIKQCIIELQDFERQLEPDRIEGAVMVEHNFREIMKELKQNKSQIFVAEIGREVAGFIRVTLEHDEDFVSNIIDYAYIADLVVLQRYRGRGLGSQLLQRSEEFARQKGLSVVMIEVLVKNQHAANVYQHAGFRPYQLSLLKELP